VDGSSLLYQDVSVDCRSPSHIAWQCGAAASLAIYIIVLPAFTFKLMHDRRHAIMDPNSDGHEDARRTFGFFLDSVEIENGYFYWERATPLQSHINLVV